VQGEITAAVEKTGQVLNKADNTQLWEALRRMGKRQPEPLLRLPLKNSLDALIGKGVLQYTRSGNATQIDAFGRMQVLGTDNPVFESGRHRMEGQSTNYAWPSNDPTVWIKNNVTAGFPTLIAGGFDGTKDSYRVKFDAVSGANIGKAEAIAGMAAGDVFTGSVWIKVTSGTVGITLFEQGGVSPGVSLVFAQGTAAALGKWVLIQKPGTIVGTDRTTIYWQIRNIGAAVADFEICEYKLEKLPFATSRVPTLTGPVTRNADSLTLLDPFGNAVRSDMPMAMFATVELFGVHPTLQQEAIAFNSEAPNRRILVASGLASMNGWSSMPSAVTALAPARLPNVPYRLGWRFEGTKLSYWEKGIKLGEVTPATPLSTAQPTAITIGGNLFGYISDVDIHGFAPSDYEMSIL